MGFAAGSVGKNRRRDVPAGWMADVGWERLHAVVVGVVAGDDAPGAQFQHVEVKFLGAVQKD